MSRSGMAAILLVLVLGGCAAEQRKPHPRDTALDDPMNYNPAGTQEKYDVSGGGLLEFDRKAIRKDLNNVLSP